MKLLIVFNNQKPMTSKIADLVNWFGPELKIDSVLTSFKNIPFTPVNNGKEVDKAWYNKNIVPLAKGYDMVLLSLPMKQWKGGSIRGRSVAGTPQRLQLGADSTGSYEYNDIKHPGGRWFNVARHEITHAWYKILNIQDNTHYWWELGKLEETLKEIKGQDLAKLKQLIIATKYLGVKEFVGKEHNPIILGWAKELNLPYYSDETPWCSLFVNYVCMKAGLPYTNKLNARSWLDIGTKVTSPRPGDIAVFWRNHQQSWEGHVGFYMVGDDKNIGVLGGNQGNMVSTQFYKASQLLGYRRLT